MRQVKNGAKSTDGDFDVFLIHNSEDKSAVETLAEVLVDDEGLRPFLDKWHLIPGEPWQEALEQALDASRACAVFLGPSGLGPWANEELRSALDQRARNEGLRVIPVVLPGAYPSQASDLPRFLRRLTWVDLSAGLDNPAALRHLVAGIRGIPPPGRTVANTPKRIRLAPKIMHALPPAPAFVGRERELDSIRNFWLSNKSGVLSLVALGGAGKTATVAEYLSQLTASSAIKESDQQTPVEASPDGVFVWSFYADQDINAFFQSACEYFGRNVATAPHGTGALYALNEFLADGGHYLVVLDGLERIQRCHTDKVTAVGQLEDPLICQFVSRLALGLGKTRCIITSRFPIADLHPWQGKGYETLDVEKMAQADARNLLRHHGIRASEEVVNDLITRYGAHALTLDLLGSLLNSFFDGDLARLPELAPLEQGCGCPQAQRLVRVLQFYEKHLPAKELSLLCVLCIFRIAVDSSLLFRTANAAGSGYSRHASMLPHLEQLLLRHLVLREGKAYYTVHPAVRDHFVRLLGNRSTLHWSVAANLKRRPGTGHPRSKRVLDILEEAIYHLAEAGSFKQARELYEFEMGGFRHLLWRLGEYSRVLRILRTLDSFPARGGDDDAYALSACYRAIGTTQHALAAAGDVPLARTNALLLQGRLRRLRRTSNPVANFLMGRTPDPPQCPWPDSPFPVSQLLLYAGRLGEAEASARFDERSAGDMRDWKTRVKIVLARVYCVEGNVSKAKKALRIASEWVHRFGAQEDMCSLGIARVQLSVLEGRFGLAERASFEGAYIARRCGFGLHFVDLCCEEAKLFVRWGQAQADNGRNDAAHECYLRAQRSAMLALSGMDGNGDPLNVPNAPLEQDDDASIRAMMGARHPECSFVWGELKALGVLREALDAQGEKQNAKEIQNTKTALAARLQRAV